MHIFKIFIISMGITVTFITIINQLNKLNFLSIQTLDGNNSISIISNIFINISKSRNKQSEE